MVGGDYLIIRGRACSEGERLVKVVWVVHKSSVVVHYHLCEFGCILRYLFSLYLSESYFSEDKSFEKGDAFSIRVCLEGGVHRKSCLSTDTGKHRMILFSRKDELKFEVCKYIKLPFPLLLP